jgi:hypothetical protein
MALDKLLIEYILIPSVFLIAFVHIMSTSLTRGHTALKSNSLIGIVVFISMVYYGFYGLFAAFISQWFKLMLIGGLFYFIFTRVIKHEWLHKGVGMSAKLGERKYDMGIMKGRLEMKKKELDYLEKWVKEVDIPRRNKDAVKTFIHEARVEYDIIKEQLDKASFRGSLGWSDKVAEDMDRKLEYIDRIFMRIRDRVQEQPEYFDAGSVKSQLELLDEEIHELKRYLSSREASRHISRQLRLTEDRVLDQNLSELKKLKKGLDELRGKKNRLSESEYMEMLGEIYQDALSISNTLYELRRRLGSKLEK